MGLQSHAPTHPRAAEWAQEWSRTTAPFGLTQICEELILTEVNLCPWLRTDQPVRKQGSSGECCTVALLSIPFLKKKINYETSQFQLKDKNKDVVFPHIVFFTSS